jgi:gamma-glutamylcyclotransferase (GGCT)/AIG2-like uncharacterized protein YtfP
MSAETPQSPLRIFVYGSLKRGCRNHQRYCSGFREVYQAAVLGRLYLQPSGYPMLVIPPEHILAMGTRDAEHNLAEQVRHTEATDISGPPPEGDWEWISGEIFSFADTAERFAQLDYLEDFRPGERCLYDRVLARAKLQQREPRWKTVWTYIAPHGFPPTGSTRLGTSWP